MSGATATARRASPSRRGAPRIEGEPRITYVLAELPREQRPRRYLRDPRKGVGLDPITTDAKEAWTWNERTGPYAAMKKHAHLKRRFYPLAIV